MDPFEYRPVFEEDQILTQTDLKSILLGYGFQYEQTKWWEFSRRIRLLIVMDSFAIILRWLQAGKKRNGMYADY